MNRNTYYISTGIIALILVGILWWSIEIGNPLPIEIAFVLGVVLIYIIRSRVSSIIEDERYSRITEKAAVRTLEVFWVIFFASSIGAFVSSLDKHPFPPPIPHGPAGGFPIRMFGLVQLILLCTMIFLYVGFRIYYSRKYGEWDTDEE